jgi:undecaprenyl-diphosphatase
VSVALIIVLSVLQGVTEFLPVSSSGHLRIAHHFFGQDSPSTAQDVILHLATLLSVFWVFRSELISLLKPGHSERGDSQTPGLFRTGTLILVGTIPVGIVGIFFGESIENLTTHLNRIGYAYLANAAILLVAHRAGSHAAGKDLHAMSLRDALIIGLAQSVALVRGISRSGSTITAALCLGYSAVPAALFSFLLAIPAIGGAAS